MTACMTQSEFLLCTMRKGKYKNHDIASKLKNRKCASSTSVFHSTCWRAIFHPRSFFDQRIDDLLGVSIGLKFQFERYENGHRVEFYQAVMK